MRQRLVASDLADMTIEQFEAREVFSTLADFSAFWSRMPGHPDYSLPENAEALARLDERHRTGDELSVPERRFVWQGRIPGSAAGVMTEAPDPRTLGLHYGFPDRLWVVVEQPKDEPNRYQYDPESNQFRLTNVRSLAYVRGFGGVYGWIAGTGLPPEPHYDVLLFTERRSGPGKVIEGLLCGMFLRGDGDHKFVAIDREMWGEESLPDLEHLRPDLVGQLYRLYPRVDEGEGWFGREIAANHLREEPPSHD